MDILSNYYPKQFGYLKNAFKSDQLHHSFIFYGPSGSAKFLFALFFAKFIQCENKKDEGPCGLCNNCKVSKDGFVLDTYIINKEDGEKISIDEIRELQKSLNLTVGGNNYKIFIINNAQNLGREAKEALLKTLEEPPKKSLVILVTDEKKYFPKTILSRCPAIFFSFPKKESKAGGLSDNSLDAASILYFGQGGFSQDIDQKELEKEYYDLAGELEIIFGQSIFEKMNLMADLSFNKNPGDKLEKWISILYNLFLIKIGIGGSENSLLNNLEKKLDYDKIINGLEKMLKALNLLETNVSKRILFEDLILNI